MPDPEIDRRCHVCGAAVRPRAIFCPQCGEPVAKQQNPQSQSDPAPTNPAPDLSEAQPLIAKTDLSPTQPLAAVATTTTRPKENPNKSNRPALQDDAALGRVGKIRKVSSVVIDQAAYDPSLRFILVAAALFLLFLVLLIMSKILG